MVSSSSSSPSIVEGLDHMRLPFAYKLHLLLCDMETKGTEHVISWVKGGKAFKIHDQKTFETLVQPNYFRQSKIASFIRQCDHKRKNTPSALFPKHVANPTPSPTWNTSRMAVFGTISSNHKQRQHDAYAGVSSSATSSYQTIRTWQHPSSTTGFVTESTDYKWPVRVRH